jgi:hypothetical protein
VIPQLTWHDLSCAIIKAKAETVPNECNNILPLLEQFYSTQNFVAHWMECIEETEIFSFDNLLKQMPKQK